MILSKLCGAAIIASMTVFGTHAFAANGERIQVTGEFMDTWCYTSQVMGGADSVLGSAHHVCAVWCAAGGIPVGLRTDDDKIYMILKFGDDDTSVANLGVLDLQSKSATVDGTLYERDGINYLLIDEIIDDHGIVNRTHEITGVIPPFALPKQ
ncbi:MAG: hypothetical protein OEQ39_08880 [Gammaproteobacteria bacterium]|nr:hypothetical protein [Gammaproteobacteria bacterium]MDH3464910.1 hypothetical protein [Gammaproteobacteria bacterium]